MKAAKRKELVNELRSAHFSLGFESLNNIFFIKQIRAKILIRI